MKAYNFIINIIWGVSIILLDTLFLYFFKINHSIFLIFSSFVASVLIRPYYIYTLPIFYIFSKYLIAFIHIYISFLYNPQFLFYLFYKGKVFLDESYIFEIKTGVQKLLYIFLLISNVKIGLKEIILITIGFFPLIFIKKENKKDLVLINNKFLKDILKLFLLGLSTFLIFHFLCIILISYGKISKTYFLSALFISSLPSNFIFCKNLKKFNIKESLLKILFFPILSFSLTLFIISPFYFIMSLPNRIYVLPYEYCTIILSCFIVFLLFYLKK